METCTQTYQDTWNKKLYSVHWMKENLSHIRTQQFSEYGCAVLLDRLGVFYSLTGHNENDLLKELSDDILS